MNKFLVVLDHDNKTVCHKYSLEGTTEKELIDTHELFGFRQEIELKVMSDSELEELSYTEDL